MSRTRRSTVVTNGLSIIWRVALYIRLSKEDGNDVSYSVINQEKRLRDYLSRMGMEEETVLVDVYVDDGYTGTDSDRDNFQRMLADIMAKKVNCVIVKDPSRLSRNYIEAGLYMEQLFVKYDVRFISLELPALDSYKCPEQMNSIQVPIQNVINDDFCRQTSIKVRGTLNEKRADGEFIGAFAPYGYLKDPEDRHHLIVNPETAPVVKDIFSWFVNDGMSKNGIVKRLIALGIPGPAAYKKKLGMKYYNPNADVEHGMWAYRTVDLMLRNPTYLGHMVQGRHQVKSYKVHTIVPIPKENWFYVENTHEPIIDQATFDKAQSLLERDMRTPPKQKQVYLFSGFLRCADCGRGMSRRESHGYVYYACKTYYMSKEKCPTSHNIKAELIEAAVLEALKKQIDLVDTLAQTIEEINSAPTVRNESMRLTQLLKVKVRERAKVTAAIDDLYLDWKSGDITREDYRRMKIKFEAQAEQLQENIEQLEQENQVMANGITSDDPYLTSFLKYKNIKALDRGIVVELIKMIYIHADKSLTIEFNFADQYQRIVDFIENNRREIRVLRNEAV